MTILELLQDTEIEAYIQGRYTRILVTSPAPWFEVLGAIRQGGPYTISLYTGEREDEACEAFKLHEEKKSK